MSRFTVGERRGTIILLVVMVIMVICTAYFTGAWRDDEIFAEETVATDSIKSDEKSVETDTIAATGACRSKNKRKRRIYGGASDGNGIRNRDYLNEPIDGR